MTARSGKYGLDDLVEATDGQKRTPNTAGLDLLAEYARNNDLAQEFGVSPHMIER